MSWIQSVFCIPCAGCRDPDDIHKLNSILPDPNSGQSSVISGSSTNFSKMGVVIHDELECPLADLNRKAPLDSRIEQARLRARCPFHEHDPPSRFPIRREITFKISANNSEYHPTRGSSTLLQNIGGGDRIREFCTRFYARAFVDFQLAPFFFSLDGPTMQAKRLGDWIVEQMGGEGTPWEDSGRWGSREASHMEAWNNYKREPSKRGQPFKLDDTRCWMRIHFWAVRECGLSSHLPFWNWYIQFIGHFAQLYEVKAKDYAQEDAEWSADPNNIGKYQLMGNRRYRNLLVIILCQ